MDCYCRDSEWILYEYLMKGTTVAESKWIIDVLVS